MRRKARAMSSVSTLKLGSAGPVDLHTEFRLVELERRIRVYQAQRWRLGTQLLGIFGEHLEVWATDGEVDLKISGADIERREIAC